MKKKIFLFISLGLIINKIGLANNYFIVYKQSYKTDKNQYLQIDIEYQTLKWRFKNKSATYDFKFLFSLTNNYLSKPDFCNGDPNWIIKFITGYIKCDTTTAYFEEKTAKISFPFQIPDQCNIYIEYQITYKKQLPDGSCIDETIIEKLNNVAIKILKPKEVDKEVLKGWNISISKLQNQEEFFSTNGTFYIPIDILTYLDYTLTNNISFIGNKIIDPIDNATLEELQGNLTCKTDKGKVTHIENMGLGRYLIYISSNNTISNLKCEYQYNIRNTLYNETKNGIVVNTFKVELKKLNLKIK